VEEAASKLLRRWGQSVRWRATPVPLGTPELRGCRPGRSLRQSGHCFLVGISVVRISVVRVPPIRKTERNEIKIAEEMAMMAFVVISGIPMAPKVAIPETAIISATRKSTRGRYPHPAEYWTEATAG